MKAKTPNNEKPALQRQLDRCCNLSMVFTRGMALGKQLVGLMEKTTAYSHGAFDVDAVWPEASEQPIDAEPGKLLPVVVNLPEAKAPLHQRFAGGFTLLQHVNQGGLQQYEGQVGPDAAMGGHDGSVETPNSQLNFGGNTAQAFTQAFNQIAGTNYSLIIPDNHVANAAPTTADQPNTAIVTNLTPWLASDGKMQPKKEHKNQPQVHIHQVVGVKEMHVRQTVENLQVLEQKMKEVLVRAIQQATDLD